MKRKGFTLVELMVVLVIIGIILAVVIPAAMRGVRQANRRECAGNINALDAAARLCYAETRNMAQCNTAALLVATGDLDAIPICGFGVAYTWVDTTGDGVNDSVDRTTHVDTPTH